LQDEVVLMITPIVTEVRRLSPHGKALLATSTPAPEVPRPDRNPAPAVHEARR
jgi:hypothetical protein